MAKRRNLKKEKTERNRAYARQFKKRNTRTTGGRRGFNRAGDKTTGRGEGEAEDSDNL